MNTLRAPGLGGIRPMRTALVIGLLLTGLVALHAQQQTGTIVLFRAEHSPKHRGTIPVNCDGERVTELADGSYLQFTVSVGTHTCTVYELWGTATEVEVTPGSTVYLRLDTDPRGHDVEAGLVASTQAEFERDKGNLIASLLSAKYPTCEPLYQKAVSTGTLEDWIRFHDNFTCVTSNFFGLRAKVVIAGKEIERLMYQQIAAGPTLKVCNDYLNRFADGPHAQQVRIAMEPLLFESARKENSIESYEKYLVAYPQGAFAEQARTSLDPLLFALASKEDWHSSYEKYLRLCATCANAERVQQRLAFLKANPAVPIVDFPKELTGGGYRWEWNTTFKETGGKTGYKVDGYGSSRTAEGDMYLVSGQHSITRSEVKVPPGGSAKSNYWVNSSRAGTFCGGYAVFKWSGEDAGGKYIEIEEKVILKCQ